MILVVGSTGSLGGAIAHILLAQGKPVRVLLRHNSPSVELAKIGMATSAESLLAAGAQPAYGDLKDRASLDDACQGIETVITTANSILRGGDDTIESVDINGNRNLIEAARAAEVKHFIFISALGSDSNSPVPLMRAKGLTELSLIASGIDSTIILPPAFMEVWPAMVVGMPVSRGLPVTLVGDATNLTSFISARDVAAYAVASVDNPNAYNRRLIIGGPEALSYRDVVKVYEKTLSRALETRFVLPGEPVPGLPPGMSEILSLTIQDIIINSSNLAHEFGVIPTTLEEVVRSSLRISA